MWYQYPKSSLFFWFYIGFRTFGFKCREQWRPANFPPPPFSYRIEVKLESLEKLRKMSKSHKNQNHEDQLRETWISTTTPKPDQKPYSWRAEHIYIYRYRFFFQTLATTNPSSETVPSCFFPWGKFTPKTQVSYCQHGWSEWCESRLADSHLFRLEPTGRMAVFPLAVLFFSIWIVYL